MLGMSEIDNSPEAREARLKELVAQLDCIRKQTLRLLEIEALSREADQPRRKILGEAIRDLEI
jgi:hypothetical protein